MKQQTFGKQVEDLLNQVRSARERSHENGISRRGFIGVTAAAGVAATVSALAAPLAGAQPAEQGGDAESKNQAPTQFNEKTIAELQAEMKSGHLTSVELVQFYLERIDKLDIHGPRVNSIIELNPDALSIARALDQERRIKGARGPLHGIPIFLKANIDTADRMQTTAGSFALVGPRPPHDATIAARLRAAGAVILGKTNLSEWANFRSFFSSSGWCAIGGQCNNPYALDRNPCGSSSGSGAAPSANFCAASLGTETDGSIVCPATINGVVGIKPTTGLTSRAGVIPISHNQDTVGPHARTVADAAAVLGALVGVDPRDPRTQDSAGKFFTDYTQFLDPNGLRGARIGVPRMMFGFSRQADAITDAAIKVMQNAGATIIDPADLPDQAEINASGDEFTVLLFDFKQDIAAYLATRVGFSVKTLADLIAFNNAHADKEMPFFGQEIFLAAEATTNFNDPVYQQALARKHLLGRQNGLDAVFNKFNLDALVAPTDSPAWTTDLLNGDHFLGATSGPAAMAEYPLLVVPAGFTHGLPVGITFMGRAFSEPTLIKLGFAYEQASKQRRPPKFFDNLPPESDGFFDRQGAFPSDKASLRRPR
jgi:amidase